MLETLESSLLSHKTRRTIQRPKEKSRLDEVYLLIHYDFKAFAYNTPFDAPNFGFKEAAAFASVIDGDGRFFDRIFLFHFLPGEKKLRIFSLEFSPDLKSLFLDSPTPTASGQSGKSISKRRTIARVHSQQ